MAYNRKTVDSTLTSYDVNEIIDEDFIANTTFVPLNRVFSFDFDEEVDANTVSVFTNNTDIDVSERGKRGSLQLSCVGDNTSGSDEDSLNLRLKKQTTIPAFVIASDDLIKDENATIEVEMLNAPVASNANSFFRMQPVTNLSSNCTYTFNVTEDLQDKDGTKITFSPGTGFTTDNSRSVILSSSPFKGFDINLPFDNELKFNKGEQIKKKNRNLPVATVFEHDTMSKITYDLNPVNYFINVAFTAANPCVITTSSDHGLLVDNKITVFDIVSGTGISKRTYSIASVGTNTITLENTNNSNGTAGRLSFFVNFFNGDEITTTERTTDIQILAISNPSRNLVDDIEGNKELYQFFPTTPTTHYARSIRYQKDLLQYSYVPVTGSGSKIIQSTDNFSNNTILKQETDSVPITLFVSANTNPNHNTHPFNTSAPSVINFIPDADDSITRTLQVVEILRSGTTAEVVTNSPHVLSVGDTITIEGCNQTDYNKTTTVQEIIDSFRFTYEVSNEPRSPATPFSGTIDLKVGSTKQTTAFQVRFSQSMNTSTISVANASHFIYANGTTTTTGYDKTTATIQLSDDNFATTTGLVNCKSISANTGNSLFTIIPETLLRGKSYKVKVTTKAQDLGETNTDLVYATSNTFATGTKSFDPRTGKELVFVDSIPPEIRKINVGSIVLESSNSEEITSPTDYASVQTLTPNLGGSDFVVRFNESMNVETVNVNSSNTDPYGTIQVSSDNFATVVQMTAQPAVTTTDERNDTFTFSPSHNLSALSVYTVKVTKGVADDSANKNFLETDNVASVKVITVENATGDFLRNETVIGTRTASVTTNSGAVTLNETLLGTTSLAKGILRAHTPSSGTLTSIEYTETASEDGTVKEFIPGEVLSGLSSGKTITTSNATITPAASGIVVKWVSASDKLTVRHSNTQIEFDSTDGILFGVTSGFKGDMTAISQSGFQITDTVPTVTSYVRETDNDIVELNTARTSIDHDSNVVLKFSQTMNVDTIIVNSNDTQVNSTDTVILSKDSNFTNCVPLLANPTISENGTKFEFKPAILANTSLRLTQHDYYYVRVTQGAKTKGGKNIASVYTSSSARIGTGISPDFKGINASVFNTDGTEVILGTDNNDSKTSSASINSPIIFHFSEAVSISAFVSGAEILVDDASGFGSPVTVTLAKSGRFGNQIIATPSSALSAGTRYYVKANSGGSNDGGHAISTAQEFGSFTTAS